MSKSGAAIDDLDLNEPAVAAKTVQVALGHASAVETLQVYVGLWPDKDQRTRTLSPARISALA